MIHCEWGLQGIEALRDRVAVLVIVDVLSFSTAVDVALQRGARVLPFAYGDEDAARAAAAAAGAHLARPRRAVGRRNLSLSPVSLRRLEAGDKILLPSPNGSRLSLSGGACSVLAGCLRNAEAVAGKAREIAAARGIAVIPAGERWADGSLRPAIEDLLGAGAVVDALDLPAGAEARVARDAFRAAGPGLPDLVRSSVSGQELVRKGFAEDVEIGIQSGVSGTAPLLLDGAYRDSNAVRG